MPTPGRYPPQSPSLDLSCLPVNKTPSPRLQHHPPSPSNTPVKSNTTQTHSLHPSSTHHNVSQRTFSHHTYKSVSWNAGPAPSTLVSPLLPPTLSQLPLVLSA